MKSNAFRYVFIYLAFFSIGNSLAQTIPNFEDSLKGLADIQLQKTNGIGFYIGVLDHGQESVYYFGTSEPGKLSVPDSNSLFEIGPLSGTFTSLLFAQMSVSGAVSMDAPLQQYLPFNIVAPVYQKIICKAPREQDNLSNVKDEAGVRFTPYVCLPDPASKPQPILLCYLATHTSGLPSFPYNMRSSGDKACIYKSYSREDLYEFLTTYRLLEPIGYDYHHSDLGTAILGHVLTLQSQTSFDSLMRKRILNPLGMDGATFVAADTTLSGMLNGYTTSLRIVPGRRYDIFAPAGGMLCGISDMMKFLKANTGTFNTKLKDILDFTHNPRILLDVDTDKENEIALGWKLRKLNIDEKKAVWQGGSTEGFSSFLGFEEISQSGVVILSNSAESVEDLGFGILKLISSN